MKRLKAEVDRVGWDNVGNKTERKKAAYRQLQSCPTCGIPQLGRPQKSDIYLGCRLPHRKGKDAGKVVTRCAGD